MMLPLLLASLVQAAAPAQANQAEKLFRAMEKKLLDAKTLRVEYKATISGLAEGAIEGTLTLGEKNGVRQERKAVMDGRNSAETWISDGRTIRATSVEESKPQAIEDKKVGPFLRTSMVHLVSHAGVATGFSMISWPTIGAADVADGIKLSDFKMGAKEKRGDRELQSIRYVMSFQQQPVPMTLWIDAKTNLPVQRICRLPMPEMDKDFTTDETYVSIAIDGKIDAETFKLPEEKKN